MSLTLRTPVCDLLGCEHPVVLAGMGGVARSDLVAAVSEAGGFGFLGMVREPPDLIRAEIARVREKTSRDFGVNLIPAATKPALLEAQLAAAIESGVAAIALFWDLRADIVRRLVAAGRLVVCQVGSVGEARDAAAAGAHVLIAQGREAGGHVRGASGLSALVPDVVAATDRPVLAAGGIVDGKGLAAVLALGAQGAVIGTAFLATHESFAHDYHKSRVVAAEPGETVLTDVFHINWPRGAAMRVLPNSVTRGERGDPFASGRTVIGAEEARPIYLFGTDSPLRNMTGDFEAMALYAGEGAGRIAAVTSAAERLGAIVAEAECLIAADTSAAAAEQVADLSSPACSAREAEDVYMGFAAKDELVAFLSEMLEAERAGARVALRSALAGSDPPTAALMRDIHRDEARWCAMLLRHLKRLDATPSAEVGAFYGKAMAIADLRERVIFLNRGQAWVVRKLEAMLPRVRDDALHADLLLMRHSHEENIARAGAAIGAR